MFCVAQSQNGTSCRIWRRSSSLSTLECCGEDSTEWVRSAPHSDRRYTNTYLCISEPPKFLSSGLDIIQPQKDSHNFLTQIILLSGPLVQLVLDPILRSENWVSKRSLCVEGWNLSFCAHDQRWEGIILLHQEEFQGEWPYSVVVFENQIHFGEVTFLNCQHSAKVFEIIGAFPGLFSLFRIEFGSWTVWNTKTVCDTGQCDSM